MKIIRITQLINGVWRDLIDVPLLPDATEEQISKGIKDLTEQIFEKDRTMLTTEDQGIIFVRKDGPINIRLICRN